MGLLSPGMQQETVPVRPRDTHTPSGGTGSQGRQVGFEPLSCVIWGWFWRVTEAGSDPLLWLPRALVGWGHRWPI